MAVNEQDLASQHLNLMGPAGAGDRRKLETSGFSGTWKTAIRSIRQVLALRLEFLSPQTPSQQAFTTRLRYLVDSFNPSAPHLHAGNGNGPSARCPTIAFICTWFGSKSPLGLPSHYPKKSSATNKLQHQLPPGPFNRLPRQENQHPTDEMAKIS